jgi:hypothetical protein
MLKCPPVLGLRGSLVCFPARQACGAMPLMRNSNSENASPSKSDLAEQAQLRTWQHERRRSMDLPRF